MKKYALPQRLADMEHILASELAEHLDDYLDRCSAENIGFIVDTDKKSYVLCPARWFDYTYDDDFGAIVNAALRYSIGRHTYMPSTVVAFIRRYMDILDEGAPYIGVGGRTMHYPKFEPGQHVLLKLTPQKWEDKWYQWNQIVPQNASTETKAQAAEFSSLKVGYRGDLRFSKCEVIELEPILAEYMAPEESSPAMVM